MNVPSLPSNNPYAFCCVFGLALVAFAVVVPFEKVDEYKHKEIDSQRDNAIACLDASYLGERFNKYAATINKLKATTIEASKEDQKKLRENKVKMDRIRSELIELDKEDEELQQVIRDELKQAYNLRYQDELTEWYKDRYEYYL